MNQHEHFNLRLHTDNELAVFLPGKLVERVTLHEWPLACVQRLATQDGYQVIYKSQFGPTVEAQFYAHARSEVLISGRTLYQADGHSCMLLEFIDAPTIKTLAWSEDEIARIGHAVMAEIAEIAGDLPHYLDVGTGDKWATLMREMLQDLRRLVDRAVFTHADAAAIRKLEHWALSPSVLSAIQRQSGTVHHDLRGDNIFLTAHGVYVIDWQRPILAPPELDLATLLETSGFDPHGHVDENIVWIMYLLRIQWATQCARRWFPRGAPTYDEWIARLAALIGARRRPGLPAVRAISDGATR